MRLLDQLAGDIRFAIRSLRRAPGFTLVAFATLTLGIAAVGSIFSFFNAIYYAALPYHDADRIVALSETRTGNRAFPAFTSISLEALGLARTANRSFERVAAYESGYSTVLFGNEPQAVQYLSADTSFLPMFGLRPEVGRLIAAEDIVGNVPVANISDVLWQTRYGADPAITDKSIVLGDRSYRIVGVLPPGFRFPWQSDAIVPLVERADSGSTTRETFVSAIGKLRPGATRAMARNELAAAQAQLVALDTKTYRGGRLLVRDEMLDRKANQFLPVPSLFLGAGVFLLLIACGNVANLFFVRAADRRGEMAIRASLGAGRARLLVQALSESLLISVLATIAGTVLAKGLITIWLHFLFRRRWLPVMVSYSARLACGLRLRGRHHVAGDAGRWAGARSRGDAVRSRGRAQGHG